MFSFRQRIEPGLEEGLFEKRAGVGELKILFVVIDMADISQGKDRFAAISFAAATVAIVPVVHRWFGRHYGCRANGFPG